MNLMVSSSDRLMGKQGSAPSLCEKDPVVAIFANMKEVFPGGKPHLQFDLKGSRLRKANPDAEQPGPDKTYLDLKDWNFTHMFPQGLIVGHEYQEISDAIWEAAIWLGKNGFQDYSLMLYASHMSSEEAEAAIHKSTNADQVAGRQRDRFPKRAVMRDANTNHPVLGLVGGILDNLELYTDKAKKGHTGCQIG